jgi:hypothetical protein
VENVKVKHASADVIRGTNYLFLFYLVEKMKHKFPFISSNRMS